MSVRGDAATIPDAKEKAFEIALECSQNFGGLLD
jgi:hypothetical protein